MEPLLELFRQHLVTEKRCSPNTVRAYMRDLESFFAHVRGKTGKSEVSSSCDDTTAPEPLTPEQLDMTACRAYLASLHGQNDPATVGRKLSSLRTFFRLLVRRRLCKGSPVAALRGPKRARRLPAFLAKDETTRLLTSPEGGGVQSAVEDARDQ